MADRVEEIVLKLKIDNKEYQATINVSKGSLVDLVKLIDPFEQKFENAYKKITTELSKYNSATEQSVNELTNWIRTQNISIDNIEQTITRLQTETKALDVNSTGWQKSMAAVENLRGAQGKLITGYDKTTQSQRQMTTGVSSMNMAIGQFGFLLGDADMFMMNFRMGMMSVANNFPMVIQFMQYAKQEAAGLNLTLGQAFMQSIKGPGGLLLGVNAAMLAMNILARVFESTTDEVKEQKVEVDKLRDAYREFSKTTLEAAKAQMDAEIFKFENKGGIGARSKGEALAQQLVGSDLSDDEEERLETLYKQRSAIIGQIESLGELDNLRKRIAENEKAYYGVSEQNLNTQYRYLREFLDDKGWEATAENARKLLKEWVDADKKQLKELDKLNSDADKQQEKFAASRTKTLEDLLKTEMDDLTRKELIGKDYVELLEFYEEAQNKYQDHLKSFHNVKNQTELDGWNTVRELMESSLDAIKEKIEEEEKLTEKEIEAGRKKTEARVKNRADELKYLDEQKRWKLESTYKFESDPYQQRIKELDAEEAISLERAAHFQATEEEITNIKAYYARQREFIEQQSWMSQLTTVSNMLGQLAGMFNKHTAAYKTLAVAQVMIETYKGVAAASAPPPVGVGPVLAPFMTGLIIARGTLQAANIMKQNTTMPGYNEGGILPEGKVGFFEGKHDELIAPKDNFISVVNDLIHKNQIAVNGGGFVGGGYSNRDIVNELQSLKDEIKVLASRPARAFITQDDFNDGYNEADFEFRKGQ